MKTQGILEAIPPFDEPEQPLHTKEEMARWLVSVDPNFIIGARQARRSLGHSHNAPPRHGE